MSCAALPVSFSVCAAIEGGAADALHLVNLLTSTVNCPCLSDSKQRGKVSVVSVCVR